MPVAGGNAYDNVLPDWVWYTIPRIQFVGGDATLATQLAQWAQSIWPTANWTADLNATCSLESNPNYISCSQYEAALSRGRGSQVRPIHLR